MLINKKIIKKVKNKHLNMVSSEVEIVMVLEQQ